MANPTKLLLTALPFFFCMAVASTPAASAAIGIGRKVGGRIQVKNVEDNREIQELGRYCVHEYNHRSQHTANGSTPAAALLAFSRVVAAETQVVSGIKYFLKISAVTRGGGGPTKTFEAVAVVKPWADSKELLSFAPSTSSSIDTK